MKQFIRFVIVDDLKDAPCPRPNCNGTLICQNSEKVGEGSVRRFYYCNKCRSKPSDNKRVSPAGVLTLEVDMSQVRQIPASL